MNGEATHRRGRVLRGRVFVPRPEGVRRGHEMCVSHARAHRAPLGGGRRGRISRARGYTLGRAIGHPPVGAARALGLGGGGGVIEGPEGRSRILVRRLVRWRPPEVELHPDGRLIALRHRRALHANRSVLRRGRRFGEEGCDWRSRLLRRGLLGGHRQYDRTPLSYLRVSPRNVHGQWAVLPAAARALSV